MTKKPSPNFWKAGADAQTSAAMIPTSVSRTKSAKAIVVRSNSRSCHGAAPLRLAGGSGSRSARDSESVLIGVGSAAVAEVDAMILPLQRRPAARWMARPVRRLGSTGMPGESWRERHHFQTGFPLASLIFVFQVSSTCAISASGSGT